MAIPSVHGHHLQEHLNCTKQPPCHHHSHFQTTHNLPLQSPLRTSPTTYTQVSIACNLHHHHCRSTDAVELPTPPCLRLPNQTLSRLSCHPPLPRSCVTPDQNSFSGSSMFDGLRLVNKVQLKRATRTSFSLSGGIGH